MQVIHAETALTPEGWADKIEVVVSDAGRIQSVGPQTKGADTQVDTLLPAPVNLHNHSFQRAMAGLTEARGPDPSDSFWTWRRLMYRFLDQLSPDHIEAIAAQVFLEMLEAGYSAVAEFHYLHHAVGGRPYENLGELSDRIVSAAMDVGIGLTLLPVHYEFGGCDLRPLAGGQQRFSNDVDRFTRLHECARSTIQSSAADFTIGVAPHSLRAVDPAGLAATVELGEGGPIHMHLAEQVAEVDEVVAYLGARPAEWLLENQKVDENWCLIHCTQMTDAETLALAQTGAVAGLCPITESSLGDGIFNGTTYLPAGGRLGVGSDSNIHISLFDELKTLDYSQRLRDMSRAALATQAHSTGRVLYQTATCGGAQAAGRDSGALAQDHWADLVALDRNNPWLHTRDGDAILDSAIFGGHGSSCITDVWSAGRHMVQDGRHTKRAEINRRFMQTLGQLETTL